MLYEYMNSFDGKMEEFAQQTFSQFGEDVVLWSWLETLGLLDARGFYVDVGAHHPRRGSNTFLLRKLLGWTGVNIEPDPALFENFEKECPNCVNLQVAIGESEGSANLTVYNHPAANTISDRLRAHQAADSRIIVTNNVEVKMVTLNSILGTQLPSDRDFRLLTIDAEGLDYEIIRSMDLHTYRPNLILIEDFDFNLEGSTKSPILQHLLTADYTPVSHSMVTTLYRKKER